MKDFNTQAHMLKSRFNQHSYGGLPANNFGSIDFRSMDEYDQDGGNIFKNAYQLFQNAKAAQESITEKGSQAMKLYSKGLQASNFLPGDKVFPGEKHALLKSEKGYPMVASYCGPGTQVSKRINRGDVPRSAVDKSCQSHDLAYSLATNVDELEEADQKMLTKLDEIEQSKQDNMWNIRIGRVPIRAKTWLEKYKIMNRSQFSGDLDSSYAERGYSQEDIEKMQKKQIELSQEGYGRKRLAPKIYPTDKLKLDTLKQISKEKKSKKKTTIESTTANCP